METFNIILINQNIEKKIPLSDYIYNDDTIEEIKYKISKSLDVKNIDEYYLFYKKKVSKNIYDELKKIIPKKEYTIPYDKLQLFKHNNYIDYEFEQKDYTIDELIQLQLKNITYKNEPIGISFREKNISVNPYTMNKSYSLQSTTHSNDLLLEYNNIYNNTIYICIARDICEYLEYSKESILKAYFPYIIEKKNLDFKQEYTPDYENNILSIHKHYALSEKQNYIDELFIKNLNFVIYPKEQIILPIETLFKIIETSKNNPFIQLNQYNKNNNILRLYSEEKTINFFNKPYLERRELNKISELNNKYDTITFYIKKDTMILYLDINAHGEIYIKIENNIYKTLNELELWISENIKYILNKIIQYYDPSKKIFDYFTDL